jgi:hypothetical protein
VGIKLHFLFLFFTPTLISMQFSSLLRDLVFDGQMQFSCPKGNINLQASKANAVLDVAFDNPDTFRYFLGSLPQIDRSQLQQQVKQLEQLPQAIQVHISGKPLLEKTENGSVKLHYWRLGRQWVRWKLGL